MYRLSIVGVVGLVAAVPASDDIPPPREAVDVAALVRQLGSPDFAEREAATDKLSRLPVDEPPAELLAALKSPDPEVRDRAARAVKAIRAGAALRHLARDERFAARGRVDLYVAATAAFAPEAGDERLWGPALRLGAKLVALDDEIPGFPEIKGVRKPVGPTRAADVAGYRKSVNPEFVRSGGPYTRPDGERRAVIHAAGVRAEGTLRGVVVSRGPVSADGEIHDALVLATGDVTAKKGIINSVVVCDGDVDAEGVSASVVVARGKIDAWSAGGGGTLVAGGAVKVRWPKEQRDLQPPRPIPTGVAPDELKARLRTDAVLRKLAGAEVREKESRPFGFVTFFELSTVGVEVKVADGAVRVSAVAERMPFAAAGAKVGDVVTGVNGKKPDSAESLRRLLRDALAVGDAAVTLRRGDTDLTVKVSLPE